MVATISITHFTVKKMFTNTLSKISLHKTNRPHFSCSSTEKHSLSNEEEQQAASCMMDRLFMGY